MKINKIFQSLSLKLITVFLITAIAYLYLLTVGVRSLILNDEVRETLGYYQTSYLENFLEDLRYPPTQERAEEVASNMPFDIKIIGENFGNNRSATSIVVGGISCSNYGWVSSKEVTCTLNTPPRETGLVPVSVFVARQK